ncbi:reverse transcriptase domain-containing protein, partial [Sulfurimonas sp.]|uniref:reverse transcriptase domain-containing protein n=1 Tax=Sulfurimonas sp. TaxID=2022749 RepID=UPI003D11B504
MLAVLIKRAKDEGQISDIVPHLVADGISILQYADDTIIFMNHDLQKANNLKLILCAFEQLSGLKINFYKSEIFYFGEAKVTEAEYSNIFGCQCGSYPFRYLGIPMHYKKINNIKNKMYIFFKIKFYIIIYGLYEITRNIRKK